MAKIDVLNLSDRAVDYLTKADITTVEELSQYDREELISLEGIGEKTADEILVAIASYKEAEPLETSTPTDAETPTPDIYPQTIEALTRSLRWAMAVFERQGRSTPGQQLSAKLRQSVLLIRPELSATDLDDVEPALAMDDAT